MTPRRNKSSGNEEVDEHDDDELVPPTPPDGGWGWLVVAASFFTNLIVDGVCYTFGIIMPELIDYYETTNSKAALAGSLVPAIYLIVGQSSCYSHFIQCKNIICQRSELTVIISTTVQSYNNV